MEVEGGVVSLTTTGRTRDFLSHQYQNRSDVPASCIVRITTARAGWMRINRLQRLDI